MTKLTEMPPEIQMLIVQPVVEWHGNPVIPAVELVGLSSLSASWKTTVIKVLTTQMTLMSGMLKELTQNYDNQLATIMRMWLLACRLRLLIACLQDILCNTGMLESLNAMARIQTETVDMAKR